MSYCDRQVTSCLIRAHDAAQRWWRWRVARHPGNFRRACVLLISPLTDTEQSANASTAVTQHDV